MDMDYSLGVDIGTSSAKCVAFSADRRILAQHAVHYNMYHPAPDRSEQDADEILEAVTTSINQVLLQMKPLQPLCISFSAAMHSLMAVTDTGMKLTGCIIWADNRAASIATVLKNTDAGIGFYRKTGVPIHAMSPFCKLLWFKKNEPELFFSAYKFVGIKEYIFFRLSGIWLIDQSMAAATGLMNMETAAWDESVLKYAGVREDQLSGIVPVTRIVHYKNGEGERRLDLIDGTPLVVGASDGALSNIGVAPARDALVLTVGTSSAARVFSKTPDTDSAMRSFCYRLADHRFLIGGASNNGGIILQWLKDKILETGEDYPALFERAQKIEPGAGGLIFLPYLLGERAPVWNAAAKGVFFGLTIRHTGAHLVRAAMEAVAFSLYGISRTIRENQNSDSIFVTGGFIQSSVWLQILADTFNRRILVSGSTEHAALGAVILGREALGLKDENAVEITREYDPDPAVHLIYKKQFEQSERIYALLTEEFSV
jgi:gluconokinase